MMRAFLFALDPTPAQEQAFRSHCGAQRFAFNFGLALVRANLDQRAAERSYGITEPDLTPPVSWSAYSLRRAWNATKHDVAPWWAENSKEAYSSGLANLAAALSNWSIRSATLSRQRGRWHVSFSVELPDPQPAPRTGGRVVGVDLGISTLATLSTGKRIPNGRRLDAQLRRLRRAQRRVSRRRGPDRRTGAEPSNRWRKARARADRIHTRVANLRRNDTHRLTTRLVRGHDVIVIEDLYAAGTGELRREQPDRTGVRPARPAAVAVGSLREESCGTQRHHREAVAR